MRKGPSAGTPAAAGGQRECWWGRVPCVNRGGKGSLPREERKGFELGHLVKVTGARARTAPGGLGSGERVEERVWGCSSWGCTWLWGGESLLVLRR